MGATCSFHILKKLRAPGQGEGELPALTLDGDLLLLPIHTAECDAILRLACSQHHPLLGLHMRKVNPEGAMGIPGATVPGGLPGNSEVLHRAGWDVVRV
jgi:hypothetical protein